MRFSTSTFLPLLLFTLTTLIPLTTSNLAINLKVREITIGGRIKEMSWKLFNSNLSTFYIYGNHGTNFANFSIDHERSWKVKGFMANYNKNLEFLPVDVDENFPNLIAFSAIRCSVRGLVCENFKGLEKLELLDLSCNKIEEIEGKIFSDLKSLVILKLPSNKIQKINPKTFENLVKLEELNLAGNLIQFISFHINSLTKLRVFDLSNNQIVAFPNYFFRRNKKLEKISLAGNEINSMPHRIFDSLNQLNLVDLKGNSCVNESFLEVNFEEMREKIMKDC